MELSNDVSYLLSRSLLLDPVPAQSLRASVNVKERRTEQRGRTCSEASETDIFLPLNNLSCIATIALCASYSLQSHQFTYTKGKRERRVFTSFVAYSTKA